jgi:hypothetical protein
VRVASPIALDRLPLRVAISQFSVHHHYTLD